MNHLAWENALTEMEDELDAHEAEVRNGNTTPVPEWNPPADLGPLPPQLADRVMHLIQRIGLLTTFVQFQLTSVENDLKHLQQHPAQRGGNRALAVFLDASV